MQEPEEEILEEIRPQTILESKGLLPFICSEFDFNSRSEFNTLTIRLDGKMQSELNWNVAKAQAEHAIAKDYALFWEIDLGLFDYLTLPIGNQTQFLSLCLSLEHFRDTLWKDFAEHSIGLCLFKGDADFSQRFKWDDEQFANLQEWLKEHFPNNDQFNEIVGDFSIENIEPSDLHRSEGGRSLLALFCRDVAVEYLNLFVARLPDTLPCFVLLDATSLSADPVKQMLLLNPDRFDFLQLGLKGVTLPFKALKWDSVGIKEIKKAENVAVGVSLPLMTYYHPNHWMDFKHAIHALVESSIPFKLIAESHLITQWDGLDALLYNPKGLSSQGKRKLQGFCAAGGTVVSVGELLGLPYEMHFKEWFKFINDL